ncbi:MAG: guanylate kinase [Syntrophomonadaceae bacterium]|jgi:guanylate kinase
MKVGKRMARKGILFVISGPSGVGKGSITKAVMKRMKNIKLSISATTRLPRTGEVSGREYYFIDQPAFIQMIDNDLFLEWAKVYNNLYGTPRHFVDHNLDKGQDVLLEIDIQGAIKVKEKMPAGVFIFIAPPSIEELAQRLINRGSDSPESMEVRLASYKWEMEQYRHYDYIVLNKELDTAVDTVCSIINAERCRVSNLI